MTLHTTPRIHNLGSRTPAPVRERLLAAGKDLFAADGYDSTTTAAIARQAHTSESQLVKHFGGKEGLLEAILETTWERLAVSLREAVLASASPLDRILTLADLVLAALERDEKLRTLILLESRRVRKRAAQQVVITSGFRRFVGMLDAGLLEMRRLGWLREGTPLEAVRSAWLGATEGLMRDQLLGHLMDFPASYEWADIRAASRHALSGFLTPAGLRALPKAP
jgi:AcrR family transcriptional regulator